jgi:amino acid transporter
MAADAPLFDDKHETRRASESLKAGVPSYPGQAGSDEDIKVETNNEAYYKLGFWTRMGCTPESFRRRTGADKQNQLNQTLKSRHMHMIAIGSSLSSLIQ